MSDGGFLYAIGAEGLSYIKIGSTASSVQRRLAQLQTGQPFRLYIVAVVSLTDHRLLLEKQVQTLLKSSNVGGEWFDVPMDAPTLETLLARALELITIEETETDHGPWIRAIKETGDRIHMCRRSAGLSQKELASRCGFPYQVINRVEKGHQDLYAQRLAKIAEQLGVSTDYLLGLSSERTCA